MALVRNPDQREELEGLGAEVRLLDIESDDADAFAAAFEGCGAVVFAAGGGPDGSIERKRTVDLEGSLKSIEGARRAGISRFVQLSAIGVDNPLPEDTEPVWRAYVEAKRDADAALRDSGLDWTIIRPGRLTDDPATDAVRLAPEVEYGEIPRADVGAVRHGRRRRTRPRLSVPALLGPPTRRVRTSRPRRGAGARPPGGRCGAAGCRRRRRRPVRRGRGAASSSARSRRPRAHSRRAPRRGRRPRTSGRRSTRSRGRAGAGSPAGSPSPAGPARPRA